MEIVVVCIVTGCVVARQWLSTQEDVVVVLLIAVGDTGYRQLPFVESQFLFLVVSHINRLVWQSCCGGHCGIL